MRSSALVQNAIVYLSMLLWFNVVQGDVGKIGNHIKFTFKVFWTYWCTQGPKAQPTSGIRRSDSTVKQRHSWRCWGLRRRGTLKCSELKVDSKKNVRKIWRCSLADKDTKIKGSPVISVQSVFCAHYKKQLFAKCVVFRLAHAPLTLLVNQERRPSIHPFNR